MNILKKFAKYVSLNIFGMIGLSCYILADTIFISRSQGANGLTALNLVLPVYSLIFAIGAMVGVGSAIRFSIAGSKGQKNRNEYLSHAICFTGAVGLLLVAVGIFWSEELLTLLGADQTIVEVGTTYTRIFMCFSPVFMWNHIANAFVRNDGNPTLAMVATISSSLFNIVFDYIFMFPMEMGMNGAALATSISPIVGISICLLHRFSKKCTIHFTWVRPSLKEVIKSSKLGVSAFVGEISSGVIMMAFNYIILSLAGNIGVAAYGVVANIAIVTNSVFNGIAQGSQPLFSQAYGKGKGKETLLIRRMAFGLSIIIAIVMYLLLYLYTDEVIAVFNEEGNCQMETLAHVGVRLYFVGIIFAGINIVGGSYFAATEKAKEAFIISLLRGFVLILFFAFLMSMIWKLEGVWLSYAVAEAFTALLVGIFCCSKRQ